MLNGFAFANPAGAWLFLAAAGVIALYFFYRRYRPRPVTGLFLWGVPNRDGVGGRRVERPLFNASFWLDLAASLLLALALCGPGWTRGGRVRVIVLDDSLAMQSRDCRPAALEAAVASWSPSVDTAVIFAGSRPRLGRAAGRMGRSDARAWFESVYRPADSGADLTGAVAFAVDLYGPTIAVDVFTNREAGVFTPAADVETVLHVFAGRGANAAFGHVSRRADENGDGRDVVRYSLTYYGPPPGVAARVRVAEAGDGGRTLREERVALPPGGYSASPGIAVSASVPVSVEIAAEGEDVLVADSTALLPPLSGRPLRYAVRGLPEGTARFVALALEAAGCLPVQEGGRPELLVAGADESTGSLATLRFLEEKQPGILLPPFLIEYSSPLCRDVDLSQSAWAAAGRDFECAPEEVFVGAGRLPLYWRERDGVFYLNAAAGNPLFREPAWPVMMANLAAHCRSLRPGLVKTAYFPGESLRFVPEPGVAAERYELVANGAKLAEFQGGRAVILPRLAGGYEVRSDGGYRGELSVLPLYGEASDTTGLAARAETRRFRAGPEAAGGRIELGWAALALAVLLFAANCFLSRHSAEGRG